MKQMNLRQKTEILYFVLNTVFFLFVMAVYGTWTSFDIRIFLAFLLLGAVFVFAVPAPVNRLVMFLHGGLFTLYMVTQGCYNKAFHTYYRFNTAIDLLSEVEGAATSAAEFVGFREILTVCLFVFITLLFTLLYFMIEKGEPKIRKTKYWKYGVLGSLAGALIIAVNVFLSIHFLPAEAEGDELFSDEYIYRAVPNGKLFVDRFGLLTYGVRDTVSLFVSDDAYNHERIEEFLAARDEQYESEYHGLFAGKNVIFIQAESFNHVMLDPELMPTIYKMYSEGLVIRNFNTPALPGSTSDTEFMANVSLIPNNDGHAACYLFGENVYKTTLPGIFKENGYTTTAYHNNYGEYYNRDITMYTFGYDHFLDCTDLGMMDTPPDSAVMDVMKYIFSEDKKQWMAYWITYSGHQPYNYDSTGVKDEYVRLVKKKYPNLSEPYVSFYAKNMDLDRSIQAMMNELETTERLDNTVFVFFGDHIVKGLDFTDEGSFYKESGKKYTGNESLTDLYFYCSDLEKPITYAKSATVLDLLPTVADLWGFDIDTHTILGRNIFDPSFTGFYFSEWDDWATDNYCYKMDTNEFTFKKKYDLKTARNEILYFIEEKDVSKQILISDYFADGHSTRHEYTEEELDEREKW